MNTPRKTNNVGSRKFGTLTFFSVFVFASIIGFRFIGCYLYLVYIYGFSRVQTQHLYLVKMGKVGPWIVSNGDKIAAGSFPWFLIAAGVSVVIFLPTFLVIYRFLPKRKDDDAA